MTTKVLQISKYYYPFIGGTEQVARDIANALKSCDDIEQKIFCFNEDASAGGITTKKNETVVDTVDGVEVIRCGYVAKVSSQSISTTVPAQLKKVMDEFKPDVVILHYPNPYVSAFLMKYLKRDIKFVLYWHLDITKQKILGKLFESQTNKLLERADVVVATSPNYIDGSPYLCKLKSKCVVIHNCISDSRLIVTDEIEVRAVEIKEQDAEKTLCFACGRHVPYKGITYLVQASRYLPDSFEICIGGKGELTEQLKKEAADDPKIQFLGRVSDADLVAYMKACDIFCFPSITKNEAFGIALAEGMYFGKPTVTFTIPGSGVNYVNLDGVTGIECPNGDSKAYAEALMKLANDAELRKQYGQNARQRVLDNFTSEQFRKNVIWLIESLI
ncbi:MAG: glycosyltransferase [Ruminococcus sp.]|nr:glycosyltransferase [Ruminococcus sp.]